MNIRLATVKDASLIAGLFQVIQSWHAKTYPEAFFPNPDPADLAAHFHDRLAQPDVTCFLALFQDQAAGYALCSRQSRGLTIFSPPVSRLMIDHIAVLPQAQRQGCGAALLKAARDLAKDEGHDEILLDTWHANQAAHAFFRANGFAPRRMLFHAKA